MKDGAMDLPEEPTQAPAAQAGTGRATPDSVEQMEAEIDRTREQLGATVDQLAAKVDIKSKAQAKAAELTGRAKTATTGIREQASPERIRRAAAKGAGTARKRPLPLAAAAAVLIAAYLCIRQWRKR
jgi:ABC-type transporter Mla subunit MlaD